MKELNRPMSRGASLLALLGIVVVCFVSILLGAAMILAAVIWHLASKREAGDE